MGYLLIEVLLWARAQGYRWGHLGLVPPADVARGPLAPAWQQAGRLLASHGEHFEDFAQMRRYFERFAPQWEPRYLLTPGATSLPRVLIDLAQLIGGRRPPQPVRP